MLFTSAPITNIRADDSISTSESNTSESITNEENSESIDTSSAENSSTDSEVSEDTSTSSEMPNSEESSISSSETLSSSDVENSENPTPNNNWELGLIFYDSTVDEGKTPLTSIDWDATDGGYEKGTTRQIKVQINYKNRNLTQTYEAETLKITIPNLAYYANKNDAKLTTEIVVGANYDNSTGNEWNFTTGNIPSSNQEIFTFENAKDFEEMANIEGSIQIAYNFTPASESPERYENSCTHEFMANLKAILNEQLETNELSFKYHRTYTHRWTRLQHGIRKSAEEITSKEAAYIYNNCKNPDDYYWVKWDLDVFYLGRSEYSFPYITFEKVKIMDYAPEYCIVIDNKGNKVDYVDGKYSIELKNKYHISHDEEEDGKTLTADKETNKDECLTIGYPKDKYSEDNLIIENYVETCSKFPDEDDYNSYIRNATARINLADYAFKYSGNLYGITKRMNESTYKPLFYEGISGNDKEIEKSEIQVYLTPTVYYTGQPMDVMFGDDLLFITNEDKTNRKLENGEYYFTLIDEPYYFTPEGERLGENIYEYELYLKKGDSDYELCKEAANKFGYWKFEKEDNITAFYFVIKNVTQSIKVGYNGHWSELTVDNAKNIADEGKIYNFGFIKVFIDGQIVNRPGLDSYDTFITKDQIATFDLENHGGYVQRDVASVNYINLEYKNQHIYYSAEKQMPNSSSITNNLTKERFEGNSTLMWGYENQAIDYTPHEIATYLNDEDFDVGFELFDLLPKGMTLNSTSEEIIESLDTYNVNHYFPAYKKDGTKVEFSELKELLTKNAYVDVIENWNNTGRTMLQIVFDFHETPLYVNADYSRLRINYNWYIDYDSYIENGSKYQNEFIWRCLDRNRYMTRYSSGEFEEYEVNLKDKNWLVFEGFKETSNGVQVVDGKWKGRTAESNILTAISTHQDVTKYVQTDKSNFTYEPTKVSPDTEYTYKLRVRSGQNKITNLVIYDSLERYVNVKGNYQLASGDNEYWQGEFLGVDTSYANQKGFTVKTYYSEKETPLSLDEDDSWKEYIEGTTDTNKVKSLAFKYLDKNGNPAILEPNQITYVLIKMKSPQEQYKTKAYNGYWSSWKAINDIGEEVELITGINSNITELSIEQRFDLEVKKEWDDKGHSEYRPSEITVILKKGNKEIEQKTLSSQNNWTTIFYNLIEDERDSYNIEEISIPLYDTQIQTNENTVTIKNTLNILTTIKGQKTWAHDKESDRPSEITVNLVRKTDENLDWEIAETKIVTASDDWKYIFENIPEKDTTGKEYIYAIQEELVDGYKTYYKNPQNGLAITFNNQFKTESVSYDYVEIYYKQDGKTYKLGKWGGTSLAGQTVNVPTNDFYLYWRTDSSQCSYYGFSIDSIEPADTPTLSLSTTSLPSYTPEEITGNTYPDSAFGSYTHGNYGNSVNKMWHYIGNFVSEEPQENIFDITNEKLFDLKIEKIWEDENNKYNYRPEKVTVILKKDKKEVARKELNETNNWKTDFNNLLKLEENLYTVEEEQVQFYKTSISKNDETVNITNTFNILTSIEGQKVWKNDEETDRPESITVNLLRNGEILRTVTTNKDKEWKYSFDNLLTKDKDGNNYIYSIEEELVEGYKTFYTNKLSGSGKVIKENPTENYFYIENEKLFDMHVEKIWDDDENENRPENITIIFKKKNEEIERRQLNSSNNWKTTFSDLLVSEKADYKVEEVALEGYDAPEITYNESTNTYEITNRINRFFDLEVSKVWEDDNNERNLRPENITVILKKAGKEVERKTISNTDNWKITFENLDANKRQQYTVEEVSNIYYNNKVELDVEQGICVITNTLKELYSMTVKKIWNDFNNEIGLRPNSVTFILKRSGTEVERKVANKDNNWTVTFDNLIKQYQSNYIVTETSVPNYTGSSTRYNSSTGMYEITNTLSDDIYKTIKGTKTWEGDFENERPSSIEINLYRNGVFYKRTTTSKSKNWEYKFIVPINDENGNAYTYEVKETVPSGYEEEYNAVYNGLAFTLLKDQSTVYANDNLYLYYEYEGKVYEYDVFDAAYHSGKNITTFYVPEQDFYQIWNRTSVNSTIRIRIQPVKVNQNMLTANLTNYTHQDILDTDFEEWSPNYPNGGQYYPSQDANVLRHYIHTFEPNEASFNIKNTSLAWTLSGTKTWKDDNPSNRPESITIDLLYDDEVISTTTTNASKDWEYSFRVYDDPYHYSVKERPVVGYKTSYSGFNITNTKIKTLNLSFIKEIEGLETSFEKLQLNKDDSYKFQLSMKNTKTGDIISAPIDSKKTITVKDIPVGSYEITETDDIYFDLVSMEALNPIAGVTFEKTNSNYILTITDSISKDTPTLQIKVNNRIESDRVYEDKEERVNLFNFKAIH